MPPPLRTTPSDPSAFSLSASPVSATSPNVSPIARSPTRQRPPKPDNPLTFSTAVSVTGSPILSPTSSQMELEAHLLELTHAMKATLTEMLNSPSLRHACESDNEADSEFRSWVQARLMEKEMELKAFKKTQGRRRTSSISDWDCAGSGSASPSASFGIETMRAFGEERASYR